MGTFREYWHTWLWRDALTRLITVNCIAWAVLSVAMWVGGDGAAAYRMVQWVAMPGDWALLAHRPWTALTYMFCSADFLNVLVNMMWLLLFGRLFMLRENGVRMAWLYVAGGLCGAAGLMVYTGLCGGVAWLLGASAAVLAVATAVAVAMPGWRVRLFLFGSVKVIWIYAVCVLFFVILPWSGAQAAAHGGGMAAGALYPAVRRAWKARKGRRSPTPQPKARPVRSDEAEMDALLEKVHRSGYSSLSAQERQRLFDLSRKIK